MIFLFSFSSALPQQTLPSVDSITRIIPDSVTRTVETFANYLSLTCKSDEEIARTLYSWLGINMYYDLDLIETPQEYYTTDDNVKKTLVTRRGVCQNYADVFTAVLSRLKIPVFNVPGYTKTNNQIDTTAGHVWNAVKLKQNWYLFDPTWGGGYVRFERYHKRFSMKYCMASPDSMILDHMPYDPVWELMEYPVKHDEFLDGKTKGSSYFNYTDTLTAYCEQTSYIQAQQCRRRSLTYNVENQEIAHLTMRFFQHLTSIQQQYNFDCYMRSFNSYTCLVNDYNDFIKNKTKSQLPSKIAKQQINAMHETLLASIKFLAEVIQPDNTIEPACESLRENLHRWDQEIITPLLTSTGSK
jgi:transglutaminase/protease-like cytokinesis protein 3